MNKYKKIACLLLLISIFFTTGFSKLLTTPKTVYRVYLKGESLGIISSKVQLENYIDKEQAEIKKKYGVDKVYAPSDLDIVKEITYYDNIMTIKEIYNKIKDISPFTINGYTVKIGGITKKDSNGKDIKGKSQYIYVIEKEVFTEAIDNTAKAFINARDYQAFAEHTQKEIEDTGKIIEKIYIENKITIKKDRIPVNKTIYMDKEKLSQYLLFGTTNPQEKYIVKDGDTIEDVAYNNKISTEEFLIANPEFTSTKTLLYPGQEVTLGILKPQVEIVEWDHIVKDVETNYNTETQQDNNKCQGTSEVIQNGVKGINRLTQKIEKINGEETSVVPVSTEVLKESVPEIVVSGSKNCNVGYCSGPSCTAVVPSYGYYAWPASCSNISSPFGWRWGTLHDGTDIAGCGYGSNIYAAQEGTVATVSYKYDNGQYIVIQHPNNTYTMYAHLCMGCTYVSQGQYVYKGQVIGGMGATGAATGVHLHFQVWLGGYPYAGGRVVNAMQFY